MDRRKLTEEREKVSWSDDSDDDSLGQLSDNFDILDFDLKFTPWTSTETVQSNAEAGGSRYYSRNGQVYGTTIASLQRSIFDSHAMGDNPPEREEATEPDRSYSVFPGDGAGPSCGRPSDVRHQGEFEARYVRHGAPLPYSRREVSRKTRAKFTVCATKFPEEEGRRTYRPLRETITGSPFFENFFCHKIRRSEPRIALRRCYSHDDLNYINKRPEKMPSCVLSFPRRDHVAFPFPRAGSQEPVPTPQSEPFLGGPDLGRCADSEGLALDDPTASSPPAEPDLEPNSIMGSVVQTCRTLVGYTREWFVTFFRTHVILKLTILGLWLAIIVGILIYYYI